MHGGAFGAHHGEDSQWFVQPADLQVQFGGPHGRGGTGESSVAAQEEGVAGCSTQAVTETPDARPMFHGAALAYVTLGEQRRPSVL